MGVVFVVAPSPACFLAAIADHSLQILHGLNNHQCACDQCDDMDSDQKEKQNKYLCIALQLCLSIY